MQGRIFPPLPKKEEKKTNTDKSETHKIFVIIGPTELTIISSY